MLSLLPHVSSERMVVSDIADKVSVFMVGRNLVNSAMCCSVLAGPGSGFYGATLCLSGAPPPGIHGDHVTLYTGAMYRFPIFFSVF